MNRNECINYMITCEGYRTFFVEMLNKKDINAIETEFTMVLDSLCKEGKITSEQYRTWKCPSIKYLTRRLKVEKTVIYI